jgi:hypothetical protein
MRSAKAARMGNASGETVKYSDTNYSLSSHGARDAPNDPGRLDHQWTTKT